MSEAKQTELKNNSKEDNQNNITSTEQKTNELKQKRERSRDKQSKYNEDHNQKEKLAKKNQSDHQACESQQSQNSYPQEQEMMNSLGFSSFKTSKNKDHTKSAVQGVFKNSSVARKYRQYMNRPGNFNRKLDAI